MSHRLCPLKEAALEAPNQIALITPDQTYTYAQLDQLADSRALELEEEGVHAGDLIALHHPPDPYFLSTLFASIRIGATFCPLSLRLTDAQIEEQLHRLAPSAASFLLFTSGSTSQPKIAQLTLDNLLANAQALLDTVDLKSQDGWLLSLPLYHVGGLGIIFRSLLARSKIILDPNSNEITHLSYVPTQLYRAWPLYPKLKCILLGGAPIRETPSRLPIVATYGLTEMSSAVLASRSPTWKNGELYLGFPLKGREMKLIDGEIYLRGECLFQGYLGEKRIDWFATCDLGRYDPELGYSIIGRKDNQFISGGENIQPEEIEQALLQHPALLEAIVVPKYDPEFGARPVAFIRTIDPRFDLQAMRRYLAGRLPKFKHPDALFPLEKVDNSGMKPNRKKILEFLDFSTS